MLFAVIRSLILAKLVAMVVRRIQGQDAERRPRRLIR